MKLDQNLLVIPDKCSFITEIIDNSKPALSNCNMYLGKNNRETYSEVDSKISWTSDTVHHTEGASVTDLWHCPSHWGRQCDGPLTLFITLRASVWRTRQDTHQTGAALYHQAMLFLTYCLTNIKMYLKFYFTALGNDRKLVLLKLFVFSHITKG